MSTPFSSGASWSWPSDEELRQRSSQHHVPGNWGSHESEASSTRPEAATASEPGGHAAGTQRQRNHRPRTCRICLDVVQPSIELVDEGLSGRFGPQPRVVYEDENGRLICPCKCKGSQKYVHENCLQAWRTSAPNTDSRRFMQCPTCKFQYRTQRVVWSNWIASTFAQIALTVLILLLTIFVLGFVADPIINFYIDPYDTLLGSSDGFYIPEEPATWSEHLIKGLASLGLLGFIKAFLAMSPWQWWNIRSIGMVGGRRANTGRDRLQSISWTFVLIGVVTFLVAVWKGVRIWTRRVLEYARDRVADVQGDEDDEDEQN